MPPWRVVCGRDGASWEAMKREAKRSTDAIKARDLAPSLLSARRLASLAYSQHRPRPLHTASSPPGALRPGLQPISPRRNGSFSSTEDEDDTRLRPPTAYKMSGDQTPRMGGSQRGMPNTALGSGFGSPAAYHNQSVSGSVPRQPRSQRNGPLAFPTSHAISGGGTMSRSASRARPPLHSHNSTSAIGTVKSRKGGDDDDEEVVVDRGQELIRQRQKERRQLKKAKDRERERRMAGQDNGDASAPPTGMSEEPFSAQQARGMTSRSVSRTRVPSVGRDGRQASEGYFGSSIAGTETPVGQSPRDERRAESIYSSTADDDEESVVPDRAPSIIDEVVAEVLDEETGGHGTDEDDDEDDEEDEGAGEDGEVTLKDRQDVSVVWLGQS